MAWDHKYRPLKAGELIQRGDQTLNDDTLAWEIVTNCIGQQSPDPAYTSHRWYRRLKRDEEHTAFILSQKGLLHACQGLADYAITSEGMMALAERGKEEN